MGENNDANLVEEFFEKTVDISTTNIKKYISMRGIRSPYMVEEGMDQVYSITSSVFFSVHGLTHFDLPWCLDQSELSHVSENNEYIRMLPKDAENVIKIFEYYKKVRLFSNTVVLDLTEKSRCMDEFVDPKTGLLRESITEDGFENLMKNLEVTKNEIEEKVEYHDLLNSFLLIKTGWKDKFGNLISNLNNPFFELRHPYLVNPYMNFDTIKWITKDIKPKIWGIGTDCHSLNNPVFYSRPYLIPSYAQRYFDNHHKDLKYRPVSLMQLCNSRYYLKSLVNMDHIQINGDYTKGKLLLIPVDFSLRDAIVSRVFFMEDP